MRIPCSHAVFKGKRKTQESRAERCKERKKAGESQSPKTGGRGQSQEPGWPLAARNIHRPKASKDMETSVPATEDNSSKTRMSEEMDSPPEPSERMQPCRPCDFSPVRSDSDFDLQNRKIINLCCFKLSLW